jgi:signal transduction histidine kinase
MLNNAVRHGQPSEVSMRVSLLKDRFEIAIQDDGSGFDLERYPKGNGLLNLQTRMNELNGRCQIRSAPGEGTLISLDLPF